MTTLESLRRQIDTATDLQSVVATMKTLAAVSIHQYERAADALADYYRTIELGFQVVLQSGPGLPSLTEAPGSTGVIVLGSDQGMCGQFNEQIVSFAAEQYQQRHPDPPSLLLVVGARAAGSLVDTTWQIDHNFRVPTSVSEITDLVEELLPQLEKVREDRGLSAIEIYSNRRSSSASFRPQMTQLLPIGTERVRRWRQRRWDSRSLPTFAAERRQLVSSLVRQYLFVSLYRAVAESLASENASRIAAMQAAEKNIEERLDELHTSFNQLRQTAITEELLDVVTGFEAIMKQR